MLQKKQEKFIFLNFLKILKIEYISFSTYTREFIFTLSFLNCVFRVIRDKLHFQQVRCKSSYQAVQNNRAPLGYVPSGPGGGFSVALETSAMCTD